MFLLFFLLSLSYLQLLISHFPELIKRNIVQFLLLSTLSFPINLVLSGNINFSLHLKSLLLFFLLQKQCFVLSFSHLFIQDFLLLVTNFHKLSDLLIDKLLLTGLLFGESFLNFGFFQMFEGFSLLLVLCDLLFFFLLLQSYLLLKLDQLIVGIFELLSGFSHLFLFLEFFHVFPLHVLLNLLLD